MIIIRNIILFLSLCVIIAACGSDTNEKACWTPPASTPPATPAAKPNTEGKALAKTDSFLVAFKTPGLRSLSYTGFLSEYKNHMYLLSDLVESESVISQTHFISGINLANPKSLKWAPSFSMPQALSTNLKGDDFDNQKFASIVQIDFNDIEMGKELLQKWLSAGKIYYYEPNYISSPAVLQSNIYAKYSDLYKSMGHWWLDAIHIDDAFKFLSDRDQSKPDIPTDAEILANKPLIAIFDSGVDYTHPALINSIWTNTDENASRCKNDLHGCDVTNPGKGSLGNGDVFPFDTQGPGESCFGKDPNCSHGTHVAGIIAGDPEWISPETGATTPGVCPTCQLMILKIVSKVGDKSGILDSSILRAFKYVALNRRGSPDVRVINASFGKFVRSRSVGLLLRLLSHEEETLIIGASGNEDSMSFEYPAAFSDAIAVAAVDSSLRKVDFSNFGRWVDISAPGSNIMSTVPGEGAEYKSGTSMAAPMVSGVAGLMLSRYPNMSFSELREQIIKSADPTLYKESENQGYNYNCYFPKIKQEAIRQPLLGTGLLQANSALQKKYTEDLPIFTKLDRVEPGCGVIAGRPMQNIFWILLPIFPWFFFRRKSLKEHR